LKQQKTQLQRISASYTHIWFVGSHLFTSFCREGRNSQRHRGQSYLSVGLIKRRCHRLGSCGNTLPRPATSGHCATSSPVGIRSHLAWIYSRAS
jgi:hypothetical protein